MAAVTATWRLGAVGAALLMCACAGVPGRCPPGLSAMTRSELFFGRNIGPVEGVSDAAWQSFLNEEISPRFPDGLTVFNSTGQWRGPDGRLISERGFVLSVVTRGSAEERRKVEEIRSAYRRRFMQEAVLLVEAPVCASL
jgi:hypothetical protein